MRRGPLTYMVWVYIMHVYISMQVHNGKDREVQPKISNCLNLNFS